MFFVGLFFITVCICYYLWAVLLL